MRSKPYIFNLVLLGIMLVLSVAVGSIYIPPGILIRIIGQRLPGIFISPDWPENFTVILFKLRIPHTFLMALTGAALAGSGAAYQGVFRNPLADPYLIGVASGAGLGAIVAMMISWPSEVFGFYTVPVAAFVGATITVFFVYAIARVGTTLPTTTLILAGVAVSAFATSLMSFLMLRSNEELRRAINWLLGGSIAVGWNPVLIILPYVLLGLCMLIFFRHSINVLQFGDEEAQQLGLPVEKVKFLIIIAASLTTAAAVAFSGIIGFVGLIVPHLVRIIWSSDYKQLVLLSIIAGSTFLLFADLLSRIILAPQVLPVGIVTALAGAPFFLWVLRRSKKQVFW